MSTLMRQNSWLFPNRSYTKVLAKESELPTELIREGWEVGGIELSPGGWGSLRLEGAKRVCNAGEPV